MLKNLIISHASSYKKIPNALNYKKYFDSFNHSFNVWFCLTSMWVHFWYTYIHESNQIYSFMVHGLIPGEYSLYQPVYICSAVLIPTHPYWPPIFNLPPQSYGLSQIEILGKFWSYWPGFDLLFGKISLIPLGPFLTWGWASRPQIRCEHPPPPLRRA